MDRNYDILTFISSRPRAIFVEIIKIITLFSKKILKDSKRLNELQTIYQNAVYIYNS